MAAGLHQATGARGFLVAPRWEARGHVVSRAPLFIFGGECVFFVSFFLLLLDFFERKKVSNGIASEMKLTQTMASHVGRRCEHMENVEKPDRVEKQQRLKHGRGSISLVSQSAVVLIRIHVLRRAREYTARSNTFRTPSLRLCVAMMNSGARVTRLEPHFDKARKTRRRRGLR
ncbi:hypothetical protein BS50DRAFT_107660 [Corynespora cassiicola Philippines]|uniref:Uncharacterized protein n=1 Tax=Corynespora cassiicola Philippines TaxID=1448308 RepID=A0A2T2NCX4_CORCC|nr:hypothetical protein BS50DRAFT_107660 [Corynespora cassiicola Philippines]